ncbi:hypothetical protein ONM76_002242 [Escherichia coli]|uniref:hypothetical protein n=1 Tax=Escherichia coli TaxID=562 RepID=UPI0018312118|nr:hypothetical protein [Escherichia coli]EFT2971087.1 hypothetical protein [Escherichia coli]EGM5952523.1 hypothetical protein [Escherichia coli]EGY2187494.1 hypothetical protein [Escherichia coli]EIA0202575.1 hypothetical protein [Escherichia coli]EKF0964066.1 hypothetical protein [Escherichia coli]
MDEQIRSLLNQIRILETEANNHTGNERAELFKAAGKLKNQVATLLNQQGKGKTESKEPEPTEYFGAKLPEGFENYFSGDYLTPEIESYFDNLTPEQRDYFTVQVPDNVPDAPKQEPAKETKVFDDWEYRRKVLNALGIPC